MNGKYDINRDLFFEIDDDGLRGHDKNCLKEGSDWM